MVVSDASRHGVGNQREKPRMVMATVSNARDPETPKEEMIVVKTPTAIPRGVNLHVLFVACSL